MTFDDWAKKKGFLVPRTQQDKMVFEVMRETYNQAYELGASDEREACAKAADDQRVKDPNTSGGDAIRARSN